jgi:hypothetical protein
MSERQHIYEDLNEKRELFSQTRRKSAVGGSAEPK